MQSKVEKIVTKGLLKVIKGQQRIPRATKAY